MKQEVALTTPGELQPHMQQIQNELCFKAHRRYSSTRNKTNFWTHILETNCILKMKQKIINNTLTKSEKKMFKNKKSKKQHFFGIDTCFWLLPCFLKAAHSHRIMVELGKIADSFLPLSFHPWTYNTTEKALILIM